jgi:hypothetical protein
MIDSLTEQSFLSQCLRIHMWIAHMFKRKKRNKTTPSLFSPSLVLSHGKLTGGSKYTKECADKHKRPCLHINLNTLPVNEASPVIVDWIFKNKIEVLNVAGSRASKDPKIYEKVYHIINYVYWLCQVKTGATKVTLNQPKTVDEVVEQIIEEMPLSDKVAVAKGSEEQFSALKHTLGIYLRNQLRHRPVDKELMEDCIAKSGINGLNEEETATVILRTLWEKLQETHKLKVVK